MGSGIRPLASAAEMCELLVDLGPPRLTIVAVDGPRGAGKTTFIEGLRRPRSVYKTFAGDLEGVPGLMDRGHLTIGQAQIFVMDALAQLVQTSRLVIFDRSVLSTWVCDLARARVDSDGYEDCTKSKGLLVEYDRLVQRLVADGCRVIHVVVTASIELLRQVAAERQDTRPFAPVPHERTLFLEGLSECLPLCTERYLMERT